MARRPKWALNFLRQLVLTGDPRLAAEAAGVAYADVCRRRLSDWDFAGMWRAALNMRVRWLELQRRYPDIGRRPAPPLRDRDEP
jgi:hypothetical protein